MEMMKEKTETAPDYRVPLPGTTWRLWPWAVFRGAGFPVEAILSFGAPKSAECAERLLTAQEAFAQVQSQLLDVVSVENLNIRNSLAETAENTPAHDDLKVRLRAIRRAERKLQKGNWPDLSDLSFVDLDLVTAVHQKKAELERLTTNFEQTLDGEQTAVSRAIREFASDNRFREAVTWQNRQARKTAVDPLLETEPDDRSSRNRQREELIASYAQRYCAKNDSIGFFGPVGWARVVEEPITISVESGDELVCKREVYFEEWGIHHLAQTLAEAEDLRPWLIPHRSPTLYLKGTRLTLPGQEVTHLEFKEAAVFHACNGRRSAREIAADLVDNPLLGFASQEEVYHQLEALQQARRIVWKPGIPTEGVYPERYLRWLLAQISDDTRRQESLAALDKLETARDHVARSAGTVEQLDEALDQLDRTFIALTERAATRRAGQMYASRTLVYEDCQRNLDIKLGGKVLQELAPPLSLLLTSARWFSERMADMYHQSLIQLFDEACSQLAQPEGERVLDLVTFWMWLQPLFFGEDDHVVEALLPTFQKHWADILAFPEGKGQVAFASEAIRPLVEKTFDTPASSWRMATFHNPDIMIAAENLTAIEEGDYQLILGEMHMGINTLTAACFLYQHPTPETISETARADRTIPRIVPMASREWTGQATRTQFVIPSPDDVRLVFSPDTTLLPDVTSLPISELLVTDAGEGLVVKTRDGSQSFDMIEVFSDFLMFKAANSFQMFAPRRHMPRITIDRLVVARESWQFSPEEMAFAFVADSSDQFLAVREWVKAQRLPRFVFIKLPIETKPIYMDFTSPVYINILARLVRKTAESGQRNPVIKISEMLPEHNQTWFMDEENNKFTSEFRILAVDSTKNG